MPISFQNFQCISHVVLHYLLVGTINFQNSLYIFIYFSYTYDPTKIFWPKPITGYLKKICSHLLVINVLILLPNKYCNWTFYYYSLSSFTLLLMLQHIGSFKWLRPIRRYDRLTVQIQLLYIHQPYNILSLHRFHKINVASMDE